MLRNRLKFSLRALLCLIAILGAWLAVHVNRAQRQKLVVRDTLDLGGNVTYDWEPSLSDRMVQAELAAQGRPNPTFTDQPPGPDVLRQLLGDDYFQHVVGVGLSRKRWEGTLKLSESTLKYISLLTKLKSLKLTRTDISDDGLQDVGKLKNLRLLILRDNQIFVRGLVHLHSLSKLEQLNVINTTVTKYGVAMLQAALPNCVVHLDEPHRHFHSGLR